MTDAKGLSERGLSMIADFAEATKGKHVTIAKDLYVKDVTFLLNEHAALAERLKACEEDKLLMHEEAEEVASQTLQQFEQMERERENDSIDYAQSYQLLTADLDRARAEVEDCHGYIVRLDKASGDAEIAWMQSNERLKAALVAAYDELRNELYFDHPVIVQIQAALTETP